VVINDIPIGYNSGTGYYEYTIDTTAFVDGNYTFECTATDITGQGSGTLAVDFSIDNNAPVLMIISPLEGQLLSGPMYIQAYATDVFSTDVSYNVDGSGWVDIMVQWDTSDLEDGTHTLSIMAMDAAGHMVVETLNVMTDNNGPEIFAVSIPETDERVGRNFLIQVDVRDAMSVSEVTYRFDTRDSVRMFVNKETDFYEAMIDTVEEGLTTDGEYTLYVEAVDTAGHSTEINRVINLDTTGPQITMTRPSSGQKVKDDVNFMVTVIDGADVEEVYIRIDKGPWMEMSSQEGSDTYTYTWNSRMVYNGEYDVDFKAVDGLGNENEKTYTVNVDNFPMTIFLIFIIGLVVFLILMAVSWRKGPKKAPKEKKQPEASEAMEEEDVPPAPDKAAITELSDDEETPPPPPEKASISEITEDSETSEVFVCPECGTQLTEFDTICPKCGVELTDDEDKIEPPAPEEET
jgi:hypothetical protein